jgi:hypothetical protein
MRRRASEPKTRCAGGFGESTTERSYSEAVKVGASLDQVAETMVHLWFAALPDWQRTAAVAGSSEPVI